MITTTVRISVFALFIVCSLAFGGIFSFKKAPKPAPYERLQTGDIVFQDAGGHQGRAVKAATNSPYDHCGVVFERNQQLYVLEAVQPVSIVKLEDFKKRSKIFHARRLKNPATLNPRTLQKALKWGEAQIGKNYDLLFQWDDETLYCSELVWKIYQQATGLKLCPTQTFDAYFLQKPEVRAIIEERYGDISLIPANEPVVAPSDLAGSPLLEEVPRR